MIDAAIAAAPWIAVVWLLCGILVLVFGACSRREPKAPKAEPKACLKAWEWRYDRAAAVRDCEQRKALRSGAENGMGC